jgi:RecG-like helicase
MRGAGELYGTGQSGFSELQIASLFDYANIKKASEEASDVIDDDTNLEKDPLLKEKMGEWENDMHLE